MVHARCLTGGELCIELAVDSTRLSAQIMRRAHVGGHILGRPAGYVHAEGSYRRLLVSQHMIDAVATA